MKLQKATERTVKKINGKTYGSFFVHNYEFLGAVERIVDEISQKGVHCGNISYFHR